MKIIKKFILDKGFPDHTERKNIKSVRMILKEVRENGDSAIKKYTKKFDKITLNNFQITREDILSAYKRIDKETIITLKSAAQNIKKYAQYQMKQSKDFEVNRNGLILGQKVVPLEKVGCYVPGGRYPLPSTALMTVIPAKIAGVEEIIVCSPNINDITIIAADIAGADKIFNVGGVQAIAGMAYGTETIPRVDKIVGPGNQYVAIAKREVYGTVGIDFIAGPSEVLIISDETGDAKFIAADLIAQAEHDPKARAKVITTSKALARKILMEVDRQLLNLETRDVAEISLSDNGVIILINELNEAIQIANKIAPEHLELQIKNPSVFLPKLKNYGSLFIGKYSAEVFGDYCSGPNHTLPTNGCAHYTGGLSVKEYVKVLTYQKVTKKASKKLIDIASKLADIEGLYGHKNAAEIRKG